MQISQDVAGYSLGGADLLRRAMGKKIRSEMEAQRKTFVDGAVKNGVPEDKAGAIFDMMEKFAEYGFNKSHAAAYALVAYQTAYLKANHPVAFLAASMTFDMDKTEKLANHMQEASRVGIRILPPDVNRSAADFGVEVLPDGKGHAIRFALAAVKRVGMQAMKDMVAARKRPFESVADFAGRVDPRLLNKMQVENLARAGAFDTLEKNRAKVVAGAEVVLRRAQAKAEERNSSQIGLFGGGDSRPEPLRLPDIPDWPELERLSQEAEAIGFHLSAHPLDTYKEALRKLGAVPIAQAQARAEAGVGRLKLAGTVVNSKERTTRTGSRMAWVRISDASGSTEVTLFSEVLLRSREMLREGNAILVTCEAKMESDTLRLTAMDLEGLDKAASNLRQMLRLVIDDEAAIEPVRALLLREGPGKGKVALIPRVGPGQEIEVLLPGLFNVSPRLAQAMKVLPGVAHVEAG